MSERDVAIIMERLGTLETNVKELKQIVNNLSEMQIASRSKRLECEDHFDGKYVAKSDFRAFFSNEYNKLIDKGFRSFGLAKDIVTIINVVILLILLLTQVL